jgi:hypothetical protein
VTDTLISQLLDFGALGIFAGFLIWQHLGMQKRLDALVDRMSACQAGFQEQLGKINSDYDSRIERMRERYDAVIREARDVGEATKISQIDRHKDLAGKLDVALEKIEEGLAEMRDHYKELEIAKAIKDAKGE